MVKYRLFKARRKVTAFLWTDCSSFAYSALERLRKVVIAFDDWAYKSRTASLVALRQEHDRVGEARVRAALEAKRAAYRDAVALIEAAQRRGDALQQQALAELVAATKFLCDTEL